MSVFSGLSKSRDKPQNRTSGNNYAFFMGGTTSGKTVTERSAMQMTAVYSCVRILFEAVAELPLHLYKYTDSGGKAMALDHPLYRLLHDEPNPEMSSFVFRETLMTHLLLWGNAYAQIIRNGKNEIIALYPLMPNKMSVDRDEDGRLYYTYYRGTDEAIKNKEFAVTLQPSDVLHIPGLGFDEVENLVSVHIVHFIRRSDLVKRTVFILICEITAVHETDSALCTHEVDIFFLFDSDILRPRAVEADYRAVGSYNSDNRIINVVRAVFNVGRILSPHGGRYIVFHVFAEFAECLAVTGENLGVV